MRQTILQNVTAILSQNALGVLLQNETVITESVNLITKWDSYYKMWGLLQNESVHRAMASEVSSDASQTQSKPIINLKTLINLFKAIMKDSRMTSLV